MLQCLQTLKNNLWFSGDKKTPGSSVVSFFWSKYAVSRISEHYLTLTHVMNKRQFGTFQFGKSNNWCSNFSFWINIKLTFAGLAKSDYTIGSHNWFILTIVGHLKCKTLGKSTLQWNCSWHIWKSSFSSAWAHPNTSPWEYEPSVVTVFILRTDKGIKIKWNQSQNRIKIVIFQFRFEIFRTRPGFYCISLNDTTLRYLPTMHNNLRR